MRLFGRKKSAAKVDWGNSQEIHSHGHAPVVIMYDQQAIGNEFETDNHESILRAQEEARRRQACLAAYKRELSEADLCNGCSAGEAVMDAFDIGNKSCADVDENVLPEVLHDSIMVRSLSRSNSMGGASAVSIQDARGMSSIRDGKEAHGYPVEHQEWMKQKQDGKRSRLKLALIASSCVLLIALITMVAVIVKNKKSASSDELSLGNATSMEGGETNEENIFEQGLKPCEGKEDFLIYTSCDDMSDQRSPQWKAWDWLVNDDAAGLSVSTGASEFDVQQRFAAATLYFAMGGEGWSSDLGFLSTASICNWNDGEIKGIFCNDAGAINEINIVDNNLVGTIPIEVDYFSQLQVLNLYYGKLTGSIPDFAPLQELEQLDFDGNDLSGNVPKSIFNLPKMKRLLLLNNKGLTGQIPEIGVDSQLERISLLGCSFSGPLSESLASISTLQLLQFRDNAFTGSLPASFFEMSELETLDVHGNQLVGSINSFTVNGSSKIETVAVGGNQLQGALPSSLGQLTSLKKFYAQENQFTGVVPVEIMSLPFLEQLWLYDNQFDAELPDTSVLSSTMRDLFLDKNNFAGSLDTLLANAPATLERIDVSSNSRIQGLVSDDIARFTSLVSFNASYCALTGGLRGDALSILSVLQSFAVAGNQMTDEIPSRIERMTNLQTLDLSNNDFSGAVPMELGNLQYLSYLDISGNPNLTGDLDSIICNSEFPVSAAVADCSGGEPVQCSCCTGCL